MTERELILDAGPVDPCGCRWQLWAEGGAWHIGAACADCQGELLAVIKEFFPGLPVTEEE